MTGKFSLWLSLAVFFLESFISTDISQATPQFAALNNAKCIACHINAQGGGLRNIRGFNYMNSTGLIVPKYIKENKGIFPGNTLLNNRITLGSDIRYQIARSHKSEEAQRQKFLMQGALYSDVKLTSWSHITGSYNTGPQNFSGQQSWNAAAIIQPEFSHTQLKVGYFQPSIGLRYDDHTYLVHQVPQANYFNYIPPDYTEAGAELTYGNIDWLTLVAGVFDSQNMWKNKVFVGGNEQSLVDDRHGNLRLGKIILHSPDLAGGRVNLNLGGSYYGNSSFEVIDIFGFGRFTDRIGFNLGFTRSVKPGNRVTDDILSGISVRAFSWALLDIKYEDGRTFSLSSGGDIKTYGKKTIMGAQIFVVPHVEIRPEYRIMDTENYRSSRWALQVHFFI